MNEAAESRVYAQIGEEGFAAITAAFYRRVETDDILGPMYAQAMAREGEQSLEGARHRLNEFLVQRFGGPGRYQAQRGHPRLRMRHMPFPIDEAARDRWLELMDASLAEAQTPEPARSVLRAVFVHVANFMMNR